ncbi:hypothetical protein Q9L58_004192 [Maublancomyces gigas]|uniref:FAD-binding FR-type domain-containing protein n=1 Tax=Discina gigas TaxID=1032678 RepID=A0ABR3GLP1_9PEZI
MFFMEEKDIAFHAGEEKVHNLLHIPPSENPTVPYLHPSSAAFLSQSQLVILGSLDSQYRPWTSLVAGYPGFAKGLNTEYLAISGRVAVGDPILENLGFSGERMVSGLGTNLATRRRVKFFGRVTDGMSKVQKDDGTLQAVLKIEQTLWNCPKYITTRQVAFIPEAASMRPEKRTEIPGGPLSRTALALIQTADIFFITTRNGETDMDTNLRGGPSGFVRLLPSSSTSTPTTIIWPEYSGNRLYQTLGNLAVNPEAGLTFPDFVTGNVLYLTGTAEIITLEAGLQDILPRSDLAVKFTIQESRYLENTLPIRESLSDARRREFSPYNPPVRYLSSEKPQPLVAGGKTTLKAKLVHITPLTPNIAIFRFSFLDQRQARWKAGQHIALEFADAIGHKGYRHMNDSDPKSLNDDYVRTFTVISEPADGSGVDILIRKVGTVTGWMFSLIDKKVKMELGIEVTVRGFGGEFSVAEKGEVNFIAGGVGITPLLSFLKNRNEDDLNVWWTVRLSDIGVVREVLSRYPGLKKGVRVFITGGVEHNLEGFEGMTVFWRRIEKSDLISSKSQGEANWYLCASPELRRKVIGWFEEEGKEVFWEDFGY